MASELHIFHRLQYQYSAPIALGPQRLNLWPRLSQQQRLLHHQLDIRPEPSGLYAELDAEGNFSQWAYFNGQTEVLEMALEMTVECQPFDPYHFLIYPFEASKMPIDYYNPLDELLRPYQYPRPSVDPKVAYWAQQILGEAENDTISFLMLLCQRLHERFTYLLRKEGEPYLPAYTLQNKQGSCRDLSTLMIAACQSAGLAARFVSGYAWTDQDLPENELHAWVEVYLPGAGWRGFDPTRGGTVTEKHIAMAASAHPQRTGPVKGSYGGKGGSTLKTEVVLKTRS